MDDFIADDDEEDYDDDDSSSPDDEAGSSDNGEEEQVFCAMQNSYMLTVCWNALVRPARKICNNSVNVTECLKSE